MRSRSRSAAARAALVVVLSVSLVAQHTPVSIQRRAPSQVHPAPTALVRLPAPAPSRGVAGAQAPLPIVPTVPLTSSLVQDGDGDGQADAADVLRYRAVVANAGAAPLTGASLTFALDPDVDLVEGSVNSSPLIEDADTVTTEDASVQVVLAARDAQGQPLTYTVVTPPARGSLTSVGPAFTYAPAADANGTDTFTVRASDGRLDSVEPAVVTVTITPVNDPPAFVVAPSVTASWNGGAQSFPGIATLLSTGPADEAAQGIAFEVTGNSQPSLFSVAPAFDAAGTLTLTPSGLTGGAATLSVRARDTGGTANGGVDASPVATMVVTLARANVPPTLDAIANPAAIGEDAGLQVLALSGIGAGAGDTQPLRVTASSSDTAVVPHPTVAYTSPAPTGSLSYTPVANAHGTAVVTVSVTDGGLDDDLATTGDNGVTTRTFTVVVNPVNDAPTAVDDQLTVAEDASATVVGVLSNDSAAPDAGETLVVTAVGTPSHGTATLSSGVVRYAPAANYAGPDSFTYTISDGNGGTATAAVTVTVTTVEDPPTLDAIANPAAIGEDAALQTLTLSGITAGGETQPIQVTASSGNTGLIPHPAVTYSSPATTASLTYQPVANVSGTATITVTVTDGGPDASLATTADNGSTSRTFVVTVTSVNDAPVAVDDSDTVAEDGAVTVDVLANDSGGEAGETLTVTAVTQGAHGAVTVDGVTGRPRYAPAANYAGTDSFTYTISDGNGGTATATVTITVTEVNDPPTADDDALTVSEDAGATVVAVLANDTMAPDTGETLSVTAVGAASHGTTTLVSGVVRYTPSADYFGSDSFTYTLSDGRGGTDTATVSVTVTAVEDVPTLDAIASPSAVLEDAGSQPVLLAGIGAGVGETQPLQVTAVSSDTSVVPHPTVTYSSPGATGSLAYTPVANASGTATITVTVTDGGPDANLSTAGDNGTTTRTFTVTVTPVNDAPTFTAGANQTVNEDAGAQSVAWASAASPGPGESGQVLAFTVSSSNTALFSSQPAVSSSTGVLTYTPAANASGSATITVTLSDNGGTANGGVDASSTAFTITITPVNDAPTATNESFDVLGNTAFALDGSFTAPSYGTTLSRAGGVLANDADTVEGDAIAIIGVVGCLDTAAPFDCATANGGTVSLETTGAFTFVPKAGDTAVSDSFQYTITDNGSPSPASAVATVTFTRQQRVWYVRNTATAGGLGRSTDPFDTLAEAQTASSAGDTIFVFRGDGTSTGQAAGITLKATQSLIGEYTGLSVPASLNGQASPTVVVAASGSHPSIQGLVSATDAVPTLISGISLGSSGSTRGIAMTTTSGVSTTGALTVADSVVSTGSGEALYARIGGIGTVSLTLTNTTVSSASATGIDIRTTSATGVLRVGASNTVVNGGATGMIVDGSSGALHVIGLASTTVSGDVGGTGLSFTSVTFDAVPGGTFDPVAAGTMLVGDSGNRVGTNGLVMTNVSGLLQFAGLQVYANNGTALQATGLTTYTGAAGLRIETTNGSPAILDAQAGAALNLTTVTLSLPTVRVASTGSASGGVLLSGVAGTLAITDAASTITNLTSSGATAFSVTNSPATVSYAGTISITQGKGVQLTSNTGGTVSFTGQLTLTTASAAAFAATGGGTVSATHTGSTIVTTTGTPVNVANATIGTGGLVFKSIAANGAVNGIVLNNTGATAGLSVSGVGTTAGSGGLIQNTTGDAVSFTSTKTPSLSWMTISNPTGNGIVATTLTAGLTLTGVGINTAGQRSLAMTNVGGTIGLSSVTMSGAVSDLVRLQNTATNATFTVSGASAFSYPNTLAGAGGDAMLLLADTTSALTVNVSGATFTNIVGQALQAGSTGSGTGSNAITFDGNASSVTLADRDGGILIGGPSFLATLTVTNNTFTSVKGPDGIGIVAAGAAAITGAVSSNQILGPAGNGLGLIADGNGSLRLRVTGNSVSNAGGEGIQALNYGTSPGALDLVISGNTISAHSLDLGLPNIAGVTYWNDAGTGCADIVGNTITGTPGGLYDYALSSSGGSPTFVDSPAGAVLTLAEAQGRLGANVLLDGTFTTVSSCGVPLHTTAPATATGTSTMPLDHDTLQVAAGGLVERLALPAGALDGVTFSVGVLGGTRIGDTFGRAIVLDAHGGGHGWFVDPTPASDEEFDVAPDGAIVARPGSPAAGQVDLLSAMAHEVGHVLGQRDALAGAAASTMSAVLPPGMRRLDTRASDDADASEPASTSAATTLLVPLGTIPGGRTVLVTFDVMVRPSAVQPGGDGVTIGGELTADGAVPVPTDDPSTPEQGDTTGSPVDIVTTRVYTFAEGVTRGFDTYLLLANPGLVEARVQVEYLTASGPAVTQALTLPAERRVTVATHDVEGLRGAEFGMRVTSLDGALLAVERATYPAGLAADGHAASATEGASSTWYFAEGSAQAAGAVRFSTYLLLVNPGLEVAQADLRFLFEDAAPVVHRVAVPAGRRITIDAATVAGVEGRAFGLEVTADRPIVAARSQYRGPGFRASASVEGAPALSRTWDFAEGAVSSLFETYFLLANPGASDAVATFTHVTGNGVASAPREVVVPAGRRVTVDARETAGVGAFATSIRVTRPVVAERAMYWPGGARGWQASHASAGAASAATQWVFAEGVTHGPVGFQTFLLVTNPSTTTAAVTVRYLRASGAPVEQSFTIAAGGRRDVWVNVERPDVAGEFGAIVTSTNGVGVVAERSIYWTVGGMPFGGGTNVVGTPVR